jgi:crotonobetainyl-CoA:carnitine CoA-transferase CaiB-like acyl-CoA transferase
MPRILAGPAATQRLADLRADPGAKVITVEGRPLDQDRPSRPDLARAAGKGGAAVTSVLLRSRGMAGPAF